jgi:DNA-binding CsgD family transcriptional regulator
MADHLEYGRECYGRRAWSDAYHSLQCADRATPLVADDLDRLATAAYLTGREIEFQQIVERLYRIRADAGDHARAARAAFWLSLSFLLRGDRGHANAWLARGQRLVEGHECVERGYLAVIGAEQQLRDGHAAAAHAATTDAAMIGESFGDADLIAAARHGQGRALIAQNEVVAGLRCLDETMLAVVADELSPIMTGLMYCSVIDTCRQVYALGRAREWTNAFSRVCEQQPDMAAFTGTCLVHRAEVMELQGEWAEAMTETHRACERAERAGRQPPAAALYRQGEIRRLCGDFAEAELAYRAASEHGFEPQPGLALLRLAQGRTDAACVAMRRLISATTDRVRRAGILPAYFEIMLAAGDVDEASRARNELHELAHAFDTDVLRAVAAQAEGAIAIAKGQTLAALDPLRCAFRFWESLGAPYDAARVRVLIADACRALGDEDAAELELAAAKAAFERLGARVDLARLVAQPVHTDRSHAASSRLTARQLHVLRLIATGRTNKEIAEELSLSERTIDRHVTNILTKLNVRSRTAATTYAHEHHLF